MINQTNNKNKNVLLSLYWKEDEYVVTVTNKKLMTYNSSTTMGTYTEQIDKHF